MRRAALLLLLLGCRTSTEAKSEARADLSIEKTLSGTESVTEHRETGPSLILEFGPGPSSPSGPDPRADAQSTNSAGSKGSLRGRVAAVPSPVPDGLPPHGDLLKATYVGGSTEDLLRIATQEAQERAKAKLEAEAQLKKESAPAGLFGSLLGLWPLLLAAVLGLAAWIGWGLLKKRLP